MVTAGLLALPLGFLIVSLVLSAITVNDDSEVNKAFNIQQQHALNNQKYDTFQPKKVGRVSHTNVIYLNTNGLHLDIVIPKNMLSAHLAHDLIIQEQDTYVSFGWGEENFYLNVPTWNDLTTDIVVTALFKKSSALMHVTQHQYADNNWVAVTVNDEQLLALNNYINSYFKLDNDNKKLLLAQKGYTRYDNFYQAKGHYSLLNTCNTWVTSGFKESGLVASYWTPFDKGLLSKYQKD